MSTAANTEDFWPGCISEPEFLAWFSRLVIASQSSKPEQRLSEYIASTQPSTEWCEAIKFLDALRRARREAA